LRHRRFGVAASSLDYVCGSATALLLWDSRYVRHPVPFHFLLTINLRSLLLGYTVFVLPIIVDCRNYRLILSAILDVDVVGADNK